MEQQFNQSRYRSNWRSVLGWLNSRNEVVLRLTGHGGCGVERYFDKNQREICQAIYLTPALDKGAPEQYAQELLCEHKLEAAVILFSNVKNRAELYTVEGKCIAEIVDPTPDDQRALRYPIGSSPH
jgi:hypothetical protein